MEKRKKVGKRRSVEPDAALVRQAFEEAVRRGGTQDAVAEMARRLNVELGLAIDERTIRQYVSEEVSSRVLARISPKPRGKS